MPASKATSLSSLFRSAAKTQTKTKTKPKAISKAASSSSSSSSSFVKKSRHESISEFLLSRSKSESSSNSVGALQSPSDREGVGAVALLKRELAIPWLPTIADSGISSCREEVTRERKPKWFFKSSQDNRFNRLISMCADKVGTGTAFSIIGKLERETSVKEYNALIKVCIKKARSTSDEQVALEQIHRAHVVFKSMKEHGFQLEEETYGPLLAYLIDMAMVHEFDFFCDIIKEANPQAVPKLGYYEMLLWIKIDDVEKIQELFNYIITEEGEKNSSVRENYLLALCEGGRKKELLQIFDNIDITKVASTNSVAAIFKSLGKLQLEALAEKLFLSLKTCEFGEESFSSFVCSYAIGDPNLAVEDVVLTFKNLHDKHELTPSSASYENLIKYCCSLLKVHVALDLVSEMLEAGLTVSMEPINQILHACEKSYDYNLVHRLYSLICQHNLKPNAETFMMMISLCVGMKDFVAAYNILSDTEVTLTANMYNIILAGYFREKNSYGALMVLKQMESANIKPDSTTFSYLLNNCESEKDIDKYCEELKRSGIQTTKTVFMALINAYARCGQFEKAKQVVSDKRILATNLNEIKSVLIQALATHGQLSDALSMYKENKQSGCSLEPKAVIALIEHYNSYGGTSTLLELLKELDDSQYWLDGCFRVVLYCVRCKHLRTAVNLLKQLRAKLCIEDDTVLEALLDEVFSLIGFSNVHLKIGLDLLNVIKDDLDLTPPRRCLDFLLHACVNAKDLDSAWLVWKEYEAAGLPYNIFSYLSMYQALLVSGDHKAAKFMLTKIPREDPHVRSIIKAFQTKYTESITLEKDDDRNEMKRNFN